MKRWPGYAVDRFLRNGGNLAALAGGAEGTLGALWSAELQLTPLPARKGMGIIFFASVVEAMEATVELLDLQADFPIELFLTHPGSNYWADRTLGKAAHASRVMVESFLIEESLPDYIDYARAAARLGFGRELIAYARTLG